MEISELSFSKSGEIYLSDPVAATGSNLIFHVKLLTPGAIILERSIRDSEFAYAGILNKNQSYKDIIEMTVSGVMEGTYLRLKFNGSVPEKIEVAQ